MRMVADTVRVARSNLIERRAKPARPRGPYRKPDDEALWPIIRQIVDPRPTYGYRRITALLTRQLRGEGKLVVNAKRMLRIMPVNGLTLARTRPVVPVKPMTVWWSRCAPTCVGVPIWTSPW